MNYKPYVWWGDIYYTVKKGGYAEHAQDICIYLCFVTELESVWMSDTCVQYLKDNKNFSHTMSVCPLTLQFFLKVFFLTVSHGCINDPPTKKK